MIVRFWLWKKNWELNCFTNVIMFTIKYEKSALDQFKKLKNDKKTLQKIEQIISEIAIDPYSTTHKFEKLKYELSGCCSKRLDLKNRIVYRVIDNQIIVIIISVLGHYTHSTIDILKHKIA